MPGFMKSWMLQHQDTDTCLLTGEVSFQASMIMAGESFKFMRVLEKRIQALELERYAHKTDLDGG